MTKTNSNLSLKDLLTLAYHARDCAIMACGGADDTGTKSRLYNARPKGWKSAKRTGDVIPKIELAQWARQSRTALTKATQTRVASTTPPSELLALSLITLGEVLNAKAAVAYATALSVICV